jgi:CCR4-NOT transcriptional regulation complex NOT5 subunit
MHLLSLTISHGMPATGHTSLFPIHNIHKYLSTPIHTITSHVHTNTSLIQRKHNTQHTQVSVHTYTHTHVTCTHKHLSNSKKAQYTTYTSKCSHLYTHSRHMYTETAKRNDNTCLTPCKPHHSSRSLADIALPLVPTPTNAEHAGKPAHTHTHKLHTGTF